MFKKSPTGFTNHIRILLLCLTAFCTGFTPTLLAAQDTTFVVSTEVIDSTTIVESSAARRLMAVSMTGGMGVFIPGNYGSEYVTHPYMSHAGISLQWQSSATNANAYDRAFGLPTIEVGVLFADYSHIRLNRGYANATFDSDMGKEWAVYAAFRRDIIRNRHLRLGYALENGLGISTNPYDHITNPDNHFTGSTLAVYIGLTAYAGWQFTPHWQAGLELAFKHFSNGALSRPNKGANTISLGARLTYSPEPVSAERPSARGADHIQPYWYLETAMAASLRSNMEEWCYSEDQRSSDQENPHSNHYKVYVSPTVSLSLMRRYALRYASGLGLDYTYATYTSSTAYWENMRGITGYSHSRHVLGLAARHEVFYRQLSIHMSLGWYLHRQEGHMQHATEKPYYETIGIRFYPRWFHGRAFIGYNVKAHLFIADCMQFYIGWKIGKK